jgi:hypothetical protein
MGQKPEDAAVGGQKKLLASLATKGYACFSVYAFARVFVLLSDRPFRDVFNLQNNAVRI